MKRITLVDLNAPEIVFQNIFRWPYGASLLSPTNEEDERQKLNEIYNWLSGLNEKYDLGLEIKISNNVVEAFKGNKKVSYFYYKHDNRGIFKNQDFRGILKLIKVYFSRK